MDLTMLGWKPHFQQPFEPFKQQGLSPARVVREERGLYLVSGPRGELEAEVSGKFRHSAPTRSAFPVVGDWVAIQPRPGEARATIHAVLPRISRFSRKLAGDTAEEQVVAANVDTVFLMSALDRDYHPRRIERYLTLAWESGANPVVLLNKADLATHLDEQLAEVEAIAFGVPIHAIIAQTGEGLEALRPYLVRGQTIAILGSSGVGKSTLINRLLGVERLRVGAVREDDHRGRHTTTRRELVVLPSGALIIDNPGMREIQLWGEADGLSEAFEDIAAFAAQCRFRDCRHAQEPGCAVRRALEEGMLSAVRFKSYLKLQKELAFLATRQDERAQMEAKSRSRALSKFGKTLKRGSEKHRD